MNKTTLADEISRFADHAHFFQPETPVYELIHWLNEEIETNSPLFTEKYLPIVEESERNAPKNKPFLSIITRTQGKRPEMLRETLLCLSAQSDMDFELLLIGHKLSDEQQALIDTILNEQTESFRNKIRYIKVDHGNRTTPINMGFAHAYGAYVAVLDDDDIVFDHWVEQFHKGAKEAPGKIIHSYVHAQDWCTLETTSTSALRAVSAPDNKYCQDYELLRQIENNTCPLMSLAFPSIYFKKMGMIFDENLTTTEDWDYFMRLSFISGVKNIHEPTAIYRWWKNAESSATVHPQEEWFRNYDLIQEKFLNMPIIVPAGQKKIHTVVNTMIIPPPSPRIIIKNAIHEKIPAPVWTILRKIYRILGGKKWAG